VEVELLDHRILVVAPTFKVSPFLGEATAIVTLPELVPLFVPTTVVLSLQL
jgi:hypothetical protein